MFKALTTSMAVLEEDLKFTGVFIFSRRTKRNIDRGCGSKFSRWGSWWGISFLHGDDCKPIFRVPQPEHVVCPTSRQIKGQPYFQRTWQ
jgi:hypothetical protein